MKRMSKKKMVLLVGVVVLLLFLTGCQKNTDASGAILQEKIIYLDTSWDSMKSDLFTFLIVYPLSQCINFFNQYVGVVGAIALTTLLVNVLTFAFSVKSTVGAQKMQIIQPEIKKIQDKYEGKDDQNSKMQMGQEMQRLYQKHNISIGGSLIVPFLQLPIMMAMYYAVQRADAVVSGKIMGTPLSATPMFGIQNNAFILPVIFALMLLAQFGSTRITAYLTEKRNAKSGVKKKEYAQDKKSGGDTSKTMQYGMLVMIGVLGINWPTAMSLYWLVSSLVTIAKTFFIQWRYIDNAKS